MLQINTNENKSRRTVQIDDHVFTVRKVGAGEELTLMQKMREVSKLEKQVKDREPTEQEQDKLLKLSNELLEIMGACYDDGGDGSKTRALVNSSTWEDLKDYHDYIFGVKHGEAEPTTNSTANA